MQVSGHYIMHLMQQRSMKYDILGLLYHISLATFFVLLGLSYTE